MHKKVILFIFSFSILYASALIAAPKSEMIVIKEEPKLAAPEKIELKGSERHSELSSSVGPIDLRWQRDVEVFFGKTPERAMIEASQAVSRALNKGGFPVSLTNLKIHWNVVFFNENLPSGQIPNSLISGCHPGWMTSNGDVVNIYIRAKAVVAGCTGADPVKGSVADARLAQVIIHEMGHGIEFYLGKGKLKQDRLRAEGFATWFEQYTAEFSSTLRGGDVRKYFQKLARKRKEIAPEIFSFNGSAYDYAYASMYFTALEKRFGVRGLFKVYETMIGKGLDLFSSIEERFHWSRGRLEDEVQKVID